MLGYHLEQAYRYRAELGLDEGKALELAGRAGRRLGSAGRLALRRGDARAAVNLLERAHSLPNDDERSRLANTLGLGCATWQAGELERAELVLGDAIEQARTTDDRHAERHARCVRGISRMCNRPDLIDVAEEVRDAEESLWALEEAGDGLALSHAMIFLTALYACTDAVSQRVAAERALAHAMRTGSRLDQGWRLGVLGLTLFESPTPVEEGVRICARLRRELSAHPVGVAQVNAFFASLRAMQGRFDDARALIASSRSEIEEFGIGTLMTFVELMGVRVETLAADSQAAAQAARAAAECATGIGDSWVYVIAATDLARAVCDQGLPAECLRILDESEQHPAPPDLEIVIKGPATRALAMAHLGRLEEAEPWARKAVSCAIGTQFVGLHANALLVLAEILRLADRSEEADPLIAEAVALFDRKGNVVSAAKARAILAELR